MAATERVYSEQEITEQLAARLPKWRHEGGSICRLFKTGGWRSTMLIANAIGHLAEVAFHHPELRLNYASVEVRLNTHSAGGITAKDIELACKIEELMAWRPGQDADSALEGLPTDPRFAYLEQAD